MKYVDYLPAHRKISDVDIAHMESMRQVGISIPKIYESIAAQVGGFNLVPFTKRDMYNEIRRQRAMQNGDVNAALRVLEGAARTDKKSYWRYEVGEGQHMCDLFWSDGRSQQDYQVFGDVLAFDATYGWNKYNLPVIVFSGVNHHNQTCVFATAMVSCESITSYVWVLRKLLECMGGKAPTAVITDGDRSMRVAIQEVFPNAHHRLCAWHLLKNATVNVCKPRFTSLFRHCMLADIEVAEFELLWDAMLEECGVRELEWVKDMYEKKSSWQLLIYGVGRFVERRYGILEFVTNFQRCVDFLRDNEEELDFRSSYGTPVLQTQFPELEKSGAINFTREIFSRYRESLKRCVRVTILECIEREDRCVYVTQKYRRPNSRWDVVHMKRKEEFLCSCLRMESFGLPCVHILAVFVRLDIDSLPKSLVLARWSKAAKEDLCYEPLSSRYSDAGVLYRSRVGAFLQHCKRLAKVACIREEDFRQYLAKVIEDTCWLEKKNGLGGAVAGNGAGNSGGGVRDPISVRTKGTGRGNEPLGSRGIKRRKCSTCGCVGHRRTRCPNAPPTSAPSTQDEGANMLSQTINVHGLLMVQVCVIGHADVLGCISNVLDILESSFKGTVSAQVHDLHNLQESVLKTKQEACSVLPEISGAASHPKITEVLLERNSTDTALMILRWAGGVGVPHNISLRDAVTAVRARIECGLLTEAFMHHRNLCTRVKEKSFNKGSPLETADVPKGQLSYWVEVLVTEICCLCIRRNLANGMLELP
ncbi:protein FAR1-RELATED SEQUENCE 5-like [Arachis duranensis]|uniref:Protein FAR1-RELATED SEQUENCE 5-like n=1 Tax=Arachis duranensis TaxID=130453 RepID=A0A6P4D3U5_ARADU|nr:protein FAR1-RELATED SEQUENCE 5-like [Arachis duranensis]